MDELDMTFGALIARAGAKADPSGGFQRSVFTEKGVMDERPATIVPTTTSMSALAAYATRTFMTNASHRRSSGVDAKLRYCISAQTCEYTDEQKRKMAEAGVDKRVFAPITATKSRAAKAMLTEIFGSASDKPWTLSPTPDPELPKRVEAIAAAQAEAEMNETLMRLRASGVQQLPADQLAVLMRLLSERTRDRYAQILNERKTFARNRAKLMESKIHDMMIEGGWLKAFGEYVDYICTYGTGIIIGPVPRVVAVNKLIEGRRGVPKYVCKYELRPTWEAVNPMDCYPAPGAKDIDDGPLCIRVRYMPNELRQFADAAGTRKNPDIACGWMPETVKAMLDHNPAGGLKLDIEPYDQVRRTAERGGFDSTDDCALEGIRIFASVRGSMLHDMGIYRNRGGERLFFDRFYRVEAIVIGGYVVYCRIIDDRLGLPVSKGVFYEIPGSWWGEAIADKLFLVQNTMNNAIKALMQNMSAASGPMYWMSDVSRVIDKDGSGLKIKPHKMWFFNTPMGGNTGAPIGTIQVPSNASELLAVWDKMKLQADDDSGIPAYTYGQSAGQGGALRTASGLQTFTEAASRGMKMVVGTTDRLVTRDQVRKTATWILLYGDDPNIKGDCDVNPDGVMGKILRAQQEQQRLQVLNLITKNQYLMQLCGPKGLVALLRPSLRDIEVNPDDVLPSEERMAELETLQKIEQLFAATNARAGAMQNMQAAMEAQNGQQPGGAGEEPPPGSVEERRMAA